MGGEREGSIPLGEKQKRVLFWGGGTPLGKRSRGVLDLWGEGGGTRCRIRTKGGGG